MENKVNHARVYFDARSMNEGFARMVVMGFLMEMNPTMDDLQDVKTAVSEAVTNAIIHGYGVDDNEHIYGQACPQVELMCEREGNKITIVVEDHGVGIADVDEARQPFFTTKLEEERSGMGFAFMETFMDEVKVFSKVGMGTRVEMSKYIECEATKEQCGE